MIGRPIRNPKRYSVRIIKYVIELAKLTPRYA